jgi:hypothetical protein
LNLASMLNSSSCLYASDDCLIVVSLLLVATFIWLLFLSAPK